MRGRGRKLALAFGTVKYRSPFGMALQTESSAKSETMCSKFMLAGAVLLFFCGTSLCQEPKQQQQPELFKLVRNWAEKLGGELWHLGELVTRRNQAIESYKHTSIQTEDGEALLKDIAEKIKKLMDDKVKSVQRIMETAENLAVSQKDDVDPSYDFYNAKNLTNSAPNASLDDQKDQEVNEAAGEESDVFRRYARFEHMVESEGYQQDRNAGASPEETTSEDEERKSDEEDIEDEEQGPMASQKPPGDKRSLPLYPNPHFYNIPVNLNYSAVHVPSNVYERSKEVIKGIKWSEDLDDIFRDNYRNDPTLSWQYFGGATGFMRQYPAIIWSQEPIDLFDCRTRSWYIEAASSPKDIIILVDRSGSMTGMRREIARHVVNNILDTLGNNDYVNIFTFSNTTDPTVDCFNNTLVQANLANIRVLKESMSMFKTEQIANFSLALTMAFQLLQDYRENREGQGAQCNQAIMLITDGVQYNYKEIFQKYNWQNIPFMPVRVFTYLIGREVSDVREVKWMACANQGYYVHLSTYAEVREQVLQYIPVMARPMVLNPKVKPNPTWSPVYADVTDPKLTNWLWVTRERNKQYERFLMYGRNKTLIIPDEHDKKYVHQQKLKQDNYGELQTYRLMTSVSLPVYDRRPNANITENIQINEAVWITVTRETRVANLLGVAGTDVPIEFIQRLMMHHRLGVNGYAFIVTNNGYVLTHPDLRPVFQGILKPAYNRVDVTEIEIMDDENEPREFSEEIKNLRRNIVMQVKGETTLKVKTHLDDMHRIILSKRHYYYMGIEKTPFSLVVALPSRYGFYRVQYPLEYDIHRMRSSTNHKFFLQLFHGNWTIHPDWHYCRYLDGRYRFQNYKEELFHFFNMMEQPGWKWVEEECDRKLICKLVADAKMTDWFSHNISTSNKEDNGNEFIKRFGITVAFLATQSGLTRWQDFPQNVEDKGVKDRPHFHHIHNRAIDEVWYKRAVEQHYIEPRSFVYSVPFDVDEEEENYTLVTATHAIFREEGPKKAPAAVVGFQFYYSALYSLFTKITSSCGDIMQCRRTCTSEELFCVVLDDNGYIVVSYSRHNRPNIGTFFGDYRPDIMEQLVEEGIYKANRMFDYQATCFPSIAVINPAGRMYTPLRHFTELFNWLVGTLVWLLKNVLSNELDESVYPDHDGEGEHAENDQATIRASDKEFDPRLFINKTRPEPCDTEMWLYTLTLYNDKNISSSGYNRTMTNCSRPFLVQPVIGSNMILLVINMLCPDKKYIKQANDYITEEIESRPLRPTIPEEVYYNMSLACYKVINNDFPRRHYMSCINRSIHEKEIQLCGRATSFSAPILIVSFIVFLVGDL